MSDKHTAGPWTWDRDHNPHCLEGFDGRNVLSAEEYAGACWIEIENDADRRLIGAAPDLFTAIEGVMDILGRAESNASGNPEWDYVGPRVAAVRAALKKAKGEA